MEKSITIVIPTYKEKDNISPLVDRIHNSLSNYKYNILFVDDDSNDGTAELVNSLSTKYPVAILARKNKRGLASAVVDGIHQASGEVIVVMDADLQHPPETLVDLLKKIDAGSDMVIASRYVEGSTCPGQEWGLARSINSKGATFVAHMLLPPTRGIKDPMAGFFAFTKKSIINADLNPVGYKILLEILIQGNFKNIAEIPYSFQVRERGKSKLNFREQLAYLKHIGSLMRRSGELKRFFKFAVVGASGILVNEGFLWLLTDLVGLVYLLSAVISIELSVISNFFLNDIFTFHDRRSSGIYSMLVRLVKFNLISMFGMVLNLGLLWLFTQVFGVYYLVSNVIGIALAFLVNYGISTLWAWK